MPAVSGRELFRVLASAAAALWLTAPAARAAELPPGSQLSVRLTSSVSSRTSRPGDPVEAVLIAPARRADETVVPAGCVLHGTVAARRGGFGHRAALRLRFDELVTADGRRVPIDARVAEVDNAGEEVAADGTIRGLSTFANPPSPAHFALLAAAHAHPLLLALVEIGRLAKERMQRTTVEYGPGVELELELEQPVSGLAEPLAGPAPPSLVAPAVFWASLQAGDLPAMVGGFPLLAVAPKAGRPSDLTNLLLVGSRAEVEAAFAAAGWVRATDLHAGTAVRALLALAGHRGYGPAPVSRLEIDGRAPDLVFEKQCDTLTKRHHVRLWGGFTGPGGRPAWLGAASHDVGIVFSRPEHTFTHRVEARIDRERTKIVDDLAFAGRVAGTSLVERPLAPRSFTTAAGAGIETDGRIAVVLLEPEPGGGTTVAAAVPPDPASP